jgi:hypothetical protein
MPTRQASCPSRRSPRQDLGPSRMRRSSANARPSAWWCLCHPGGCNGAWLSSAAGNAREWRKVMDSMVASAASVGARTPIPDQMIAAMQRQLELVQEVFEPTVGTLRQPAARAKAAAGLDRHRGQSIAGDSDRGGSATAGRCRRSAPRFSAPPGYVRDLQAADPPDALITTFGCARMITGPPRIGSKTGGSSSYASQRVIH